MAIIPVEDYVLFTEKGFLSEQALAWCEDISEETNSLSDRQGVIQAVNTQTGAQISGSTIMPFNDDTRQITEGNEVLSVSITPENVLNKLRFDIVLNTSSSVNSTWIASALFQDAIADCLASNLRFNLGASGIYPVFFTFWMEAGTILETTFTVRMGGHTAGTFYINSAGALPEQNGFMFSSITVTEYSQ